MTGHGSRFTSRGYKRLKPFIKIHDRPMIDWVVNMFPGSKKDITFILRNEHLKSKTYLRKDLNKIANDASIFKIDNWLKKGPVSDVLRASEIIKDSEPVLVSYCDFYMDWDFKKFKEYIKKKNPDGVIPCYTGFHPHLAHKDNLYATCEVDAHHRLQKIREKFQLHKNKFLDFQSPGIYYFKSGKILKEYCNKLISSKQSINGEYYMSLPFNFMIEDNLKVLCPPMVSYFCQWGTPEDLEEYKYWINIMKNIKSL